MPQRALVLGSQIDELRGVENDAQAMAAMLASRGFDVDLRVGGDASRAGILAGYDQLIAASNPDDVAVIYYCGHGFHSAVPHHVRSWQCIAPTDLRASTDTEWRGITAWELSIKQTQLTARTLNVTVILDCCHSAQLSRSDGAIGAVPRALPHPVRLGFDRHLAALRAAYGTGFDAVDPVGNLSAVRVVACGQSEAAFEFPDANGQYHGVFTEVLIDVLTQVGTAPVSWAAIIGAIRARVSRRFVRQRPDIEGPVHRGLFSLTEYDDVRRVVVTAAGERFRLSAGRLTGAGVGDIYGVSPDSMLSDHDAHIFAQLEVVEVSPTEATARLIAGVGPIPANAVAIPLDRQVPKWPVAVAGPEPACTSVRRAIDASPTLRAALPGEGGTLAVVRIDDEDITIEDARGPLFPAVRFPSGIPSVLGHLVDLGISQGIRELEGEHGVRATELAIELGIVRDACARPLPEHGAVLDLHDRYYLTIERRGERPLFVHVLGINARGKIALLTHFARGGIDLGRSNPTVTLGQRTDGALVGVGLRWPDGLPAAGMARLTELVVVATLTISDLSGLEARDLTFDRSSPSQLQRALAGLCSGVCHDMRDDNALSGFFIKRVSFLLAPSDAVAAVSYDAD
ncbi:MAG: caspase family protein [Myxococcales bacterium]|nr:caspase family protein [Myxococcales bacterium]